MKKTRRRVFMKNCCPRITVFAFNYLFSIMLLLTVPCSSFASPSLEKFKAEFKKMDWEKRLVAMEKLKGMKDDETVEFLMSVADDRKEHWTVQIKAIQFMGEIRNPKTLDLLLSIFTSRSSVYECPAIKSYTATALGNFRGYGDVMDPLIAGINNKEPLVREASVQALGNIGNAKAVPHLIPLLRSSSLAMRLSAIKALESIGDPQSITPLEEVAGKDNDRIARETAALAARNLRRSQKEKSPLPD
jgi:HEAT repeat protein